MSETTEAHLRGQLLELLEQAGGLLEALPPGIYARPHAKCYGSSIGQHLRHSLEFMEAVAVAARTCLVDYDARPRNERLESDPGCARGKIRDLQGLMGGLPEGAAWELRVEGMDGRRVATTSARELCFLSSHTVHHYAMIGTLCQLHDVSMPEGFGVARSTLAYRQRRS